MGSGQQPPPPHDRARLVDDFRRRGEEAFEILPMPVQKDKGWEFTDLSELDLDSFEPADDG